jgi:hypothetical protein
VGAYRNGWIVMAGDRPVLLYRARFRPRSLVLPPGQIDLRRGFWADVAVIRSDRLRYFLYFLKDGPAPELALDQLSQRATATT